LANAHKPLQKTDDSALQIKEGAGDDGSKQAGCLKEEKSEPRALSKENANLQIGSQAKEGGPRASGENLTAGGCSDLIASKRNAKSETSIVSTLTTTT
jgi:hypothetical protein